MEATAGAETLGLGGMETSASGEQERNGARKGRSLDFFFSENRSKCLWSLKQEPACNLISHSCDVAPAAGSDPVILPAEWPVRFFSIKGEQLWQSANLMEMEWLRWARVMRIHSGCWLSCLLLVSQLLTEEARRGDLLDAQSLDKGCPLAFFKSNWCP